MEKPYNCQIPMVVKRRPLEEHIAKTNYCGQNPYFKKIYSKETINANRTAKTLEVKWRLRYELIIFLFENLKWFLCDEVQRITVQKCKKVQASKTAGAAPLNGIRPRVILEWPNNDEDVYLIFIITNNIGVIHIHIAVQKLC